MPILGLMMDYDCGYILHFRSLKWRAWNRTMELCGIPICP